MSGGTWGERAALAQVDPTHTQGQGHQDGLVLLRPFGDMSYMGGARGIPLVFGFSPSTLRQSPMQPFPHQSIACDGV